MLLNHKVNLWSIEWINLDVQHYFWIQFWWSKSFAVNIININNDSYRCWISNCLNKKFLLFCIRDEQNVAFLYVTNFAQVPDSKKLKLVLDPIKIFQVLIFSTDSSKVWYIPQQSDTWHLIFHISVKTVHIICKIGF